MKKQLKMQRIRFRISDFGWKKCAVFAAAGIIGMSMMACSFGYDTPEEAAQAQLEQKYQKKFGIGELTIKSGGGPFADDQYTGFAYECNEPGLLFDIWVSRDLKKVYDSYYCVEIMPYIDTWMQKQADKIWNKCKIRDQVDLLDYHEDTEYSAGDIDSFFEEESVENTIYLFLPEDINTDTLAKDVSEFLQSVNKAGNGVLKVYLLPSTELEELDVYQIPEKTESKWTVSLGASQEFIATEFQ